ncbi:MAG: S8 family serine peptidase [Planctomycetes bacterium]|nr:S8 family serine peptidase [Planctomycetota bacterium]
MNPGHHPSSTGARRSISRFLPSPRLALGALLAVGAIAPALAWTVQSQQSPFDPAAQAQFKAGLPQRIQPLVVDLNSRSFLPSRSAEPMFTNDRADLYLQFSHVIDSVERGRLIQSGVRFFQALTPTTYLVRVKRTAFESLKGSPIVLGWEPVLPVDKLTPEIFRGEIRANALNPDGSYQMRVQFYEDVRLVEALSTLDTIGVLVPDRSKFSVNHKIEVAGILPKITALARSHTVRSIEPIPLPAKEDNVNAAALSNIDDIQAAPYNLTGAGVIFGEFDGGNVRTNHPDLTGRVTLVDNTSNNDHATHVAGTIIGDGTNNANARGMSPAGTLFSWNFSGNVADEHHDASVDHDVVVTNNSWGRVIGWDDGMQTGNQGDFGRYDGEAADFDSEVRAHNFVVCKSSGNDRNDCDPMDNTDCDGALGSDGQRYDTIPTWGVAKNVLTVGATNDNGTIASFSSSGPADDGRIKPDIVANGVGLTSTWAGGVTIPDPACDGMDYCSIGGTSMSTPTVAGAVGLLYERYRQVYFGLDPSADIIKALVVNSATDAGRPGPDYLFGHGILNALAAVQLIDAGPVRIVTDAVDSGQTDTWLIAVPAGTPELRATLNWIDPAGAPQFLGGPNVVNNLNLQLISPTNQVFFPFKLDPANVTNNATATGPNNVDTVEHVSIPNPAQGFWRARVTGASVPMGPQNYALVANLAFQLPDQPNITVNAALNYDELCEGEFQDKIVSIFNTGGAALLVHSVTVTAGAGVFAVQPNPIQPFLVHPGAHVDVTVRFDPPGPGAFAGNLRIFSNDPDQMNYDIAMTGSGCPPPDIAITGSTDFGNVCSGALAEKILNICNVGVDDLNVSSVAFVAPCDDFTIINNIFPATVLQGHCLPVTVRYTPTEGGPHTCTMRITSNDPDENPLDVVWTATTPPVSLDVQDVAAFDPTVLVSIDAACEMSKPLNITNTGACPIYIKDVSITPPGAHFSDFVLVNRPAVPIMLNPGESLGDGILAVHFRPNQVERAIVGTLKVRYQSDNPAIGNDTTIMRTFCGEGVKTGARVVIRHNGVAVPLVDRITLYKVESMGPPLLLTSVESVINLPLVNVPATPPCPAFEFHREWGGISNPIQLVPGNYLIEARATINGQQQLHKLEFTVGVCDFLPDLVINM